MKNFKKSNCLINLLLLQRSLSLNINIANLHYTKNKVQGFMKELEFTYTFVKEDIMGMKCKVKIINDLNKNRTRSY